MSNSSQQIKKIQQELQRIFTIFITKKIPLFEVLKKEYLPEGLKPHTRSICWLAEQVILQNIKKFSTEFGLADFEYPESDISPWDAKFKIDNCSAGKDVFVNVKVTDSTKPIRKNDIASVKALLNFYKNNGEPLIYFVVIRLKFEDNVIRFVEPIIARYYPWVKDFVVNPRNEHIQSVYETEIEERSVSEFIEILRKKAIDKGLRIS
jgi:hypothetical protein